MGILKDMIDLGYADFKDSGELADWISEETGRDWSELGYDARHYGEVESFQKMVEDLDAIGFGDLADKAYDDMQDAVYFWAADSGFTKFYDENAKRWRWEAGQENAGAFAPDPYEWVRD